MLSACEYALRVVTACGWNHTCALARVVGPLRVVDARCAVAVRGGAGAAGEA